MGLVILIIVVLVALIIAKTKIPASSSKQGKLFVLLLCLTIALLVLIMDIIVVQINGEHDLARYKGTYAVAVKYYDAPESLDKFTVRELANSYNADMIRCKFANNWFLALFIYEPIAKLPLIDMERLRIKDE